MPSTQSHEPGVAILQDKDDPAGPKLQLYLKFFLDHAPEPLSSEHFDNTEVLL